MRFYKSLAASALVALVGIAAAPPPLQVQDQLALSAVSTTLLLLSSTEWPYGYWSPTFDNTSAGWAGILAEPQDGAKSWDLSEYSDAFLRYTLTIRTAPVKHADPNSYTLRFSTTKTSLGPKKRLRYTWADFTPHGFDTSKIESVEIGIHWSRDGTPSRSTGPVFRLIFLLRLSMFSGVAYEALSGWEQAGFDLGFLSPGDSLKCYSDAMYEKKRWQLKDLVR
ncbi:hypothetical protein BDK51DRAFT_34503 [Blyttiomyces helicus]|uniref:NADH:ubiquinone oxidoreductase intermediate-associated protein 30 domain-containing protein n=1 Tax=Blyttiomyces helicus TaxID=388810 RepID=A0A4P9WC56_9FUNG|nr:hypothetical protein BDK51DRAFT_34503 [Blyttiomyces helicus]|eukprot:RKO89173.1 hypothetical protein BDK51DRAFT_34503 [Blyttiomyces helicus]